MKFPHPQEFGKSRSVLKRFLFAFFLLFPSLAFGATSLQNFTGFEAGTDLDGASAVSGTESVVTSPVYDGTYAFRANPVTSAIGYTQIEAIDPSTGSAGADFSPAQYLMVSFRYRYATKPSTGKERMMSAHTNAAGIKWDLRQDSTGPLVLYNQNQTSTATTSTSLVADTWYHICAAVESSAATAQYDIYIDGILEMSGTTDTSSTGHGFIRIGKTNNVDSNTVDYFYDNIIVYSGNNDDPITCNSTAKIRAGLATGNGTDTGLTAGTGASDYLEVDDPFGSYDSTTYVQSPAADTYSTFHMQDAGTIGLGANDTITAVRTGTYGREVASGVSIYMSRSYSGATASTTPTGSDIGTTLAYRHQFFPTDFVTGVAWTQAGVNALQVGSGDGVGSAVTMRTSAVWYTVLYEPVAAVSAPSKAALRVISNRIKLFTGRLWLFSK